MTRQSTAGDGGARLAQPAGPEHDRGTGHDGLSQAVRVWAVMRDLAENYPSKEALRDALNLGRGSGRVKALLVLTEGPLSLSELADAVQVDAPYATLIVDKLEERGLVERRTDPADRRRKLVALTPAGATAAQGALLIGREPPPGFTTLGAAELDTLEELVLRIADGSGPAA